MTTKVHTLTVVYYILFFLLCLSACKKNNSPSPVSSGPTTIPEGPAKTLAGSGMSGSADGIGIEASFFNPSGIAIDSSGNIYVADEGNHLIRKITSAGVVTTLAGSGIEGDANGTGSDASFYRPSGVAVDSSGNVYVADSYNTLIRKITPDGVVSTFAGVKSDGVSPSTFTYPTGVAVDASGNVYVLDVAGIYKITPSHVMTALAGPRLGYSDGQGAAAGFNNCHGIALDADGNIYVADTGNHRIRKCTPSGYVTTIAGNGNTGIVDGPASLAQFSFPQGLALDASGNIYVADDLNNAIRKITPTGIVSTILGNGVGPNGSLYEPHGITIDASGNIIFASKGQQRIKKFKEFNH